MNYNSSFSHDSNSSNCISQQGGGAFREKIFLKVCFQNAVSNSPAKCDFDFGSRCCRLSAAEASFFQKQSQHFLGIYPVHFPFVPVLFLRDLRVQERAVLTDQFALLLSDLFDNVLFLSCLCVVENIKTNGAVQPLPCFPQDTVFAF